MQGNGSRDGDGARRPVWARLADWLTEEMPAPESPQAEGPREAHRARASSAQGPGAPGRGPGGRDASGPGAPTLARRAGREGRDARRRRAAAPPAGRGAAPAILLAAAGGGALVAVLALLLHGVPQRPRAATDTLAAQRAAAAASGHAGTPTRSGAAKAGSSASAAPPAGSPDCASMHMEPVPPAAGSGAPAVAGLCYSLGNGENWLVGCAPGFQASCDPALQPVLGCLRQLGAAARAGITLGDVESCASKSSG